MINVILSFDTEEFETPGSREGAGLWLPAADRRSVIRAAHLQTWTARPVPTQRVPAAAQDRPGRR